ncbi:hypothetical protein JXA80_00785, partial [bacterium]|nr:hypothetical protein [candidate division CSSED10-310 bacterium]
EEDVKARKILLDRGVEVLLPSGELTEKLNSVFAQSIDTLLEGDIQPGFYLSIRSVLDEHSAETQL